MNIGDDLPNDCESAKPLVVRLLDGTQGKIEIPVENPLKGRLVSVANKDYIIDKYEEKDIAICDPEDFDKRSHLVKMRIEAAFGFALALGIRLNGATVSIYLNDVFLGSWGPVVGLPSLPVWSYYGQHTEYTAIEESIDLPTIEKDEIIAIFGSIETDITHVEKQKHNTIRFQFANTAAPEIGGDGVVIFYIAKTKRYNELRSVTEILNNPFRDYPATKYYTAFFESFGGVSSQQIINVEFEFPDLVDMITDGDSLHVF